jgi:hypothetical protein
METKVFSLFNQSGKMEEIKPISSLPMYCKVYHYGYGMDSTQGAIISASDQYGNYKVVNISDYNPGFSQLDKYSRPHSKKFGIGIYYDDNFQTWDEITVNKYIKLAELHVIKVKEETEAKQKKDEQEKNDLPKLFPYLTVNYSDDEKITKSNLVAELKKNFPAIKFSVKKEHYDCYNVSWINGPTMNEVTKITNKYENSENDITGDFRDYAPSNFNRVFGGYKYVFENRHISDEINNLLPELITLLGNYTELYPEQILRRIVDKVNIPVNATNFKIIRTSETCGQIEDFYNLTFEIPNQEIKKETTGDIQIINYSDKSIAVIGNTRDIKDTLKQMGGRFNFHLSCGPGWIFPATKKDLLTKLFN